MAGPVVAAAISSCLLYTSRCVYETVINYAKNLGIKELYGEVLRENEAMLRLNRALNFSFHTSPDDPGVIHVTLPLN